VPPGPRLNYRFSSVPKDFPLQKRRAVLEVLLRHACKALLGRTLARQEKSLFTRLVTKIVVSLRGMASATAASQAHGSSHGKPVAYEEVSLFQALGPHPNPVCNSGKTL
jgi:hypothetical protein